jgi:hypothetical protein
MLNRLLKTIDELCGSVVSARAVYLVVRFALYIRKGQQQMMADYLMLELVEQGRM